MSTIDDVGLVNASASTIARRSGLSWGVIQYHFGDRLGLLLAVFDHTIGEYCARLAELPVPVGTIEDRTTQLIAMLWQIMTTDIYRTTLEIQLHLNRQSAATDTYRSGLARAARATRQAWRDAFPDIDRSTVDRVQTAAMSAIRGLAVTHALGATERSSVDPRRTIIEMTTRALST
ncbi:MAG TPA: TetR/AcrR family transcriptional regulator [Acidimicrobiia bacterium]